MREAAFVLASVALVVSLLTLWRAGQAAGDRDSQPADSNDVVVAVAVGAVIVALALMAVVLAVLS